MYRTFRENYINYFKEELNDYCSYRGQDKYILRQNDDFEHNNNLAAYVGCISPDEDHSGVYSDLSIVIFPSNEADDQDDRWLIALIVGSAGFKNDFELASLPGTRRVFINCLKNTNSFIKSNFTDIDSKDSISNYVSFLPQALKTSIDKYGRYILAASIINPNQEQATKNTIELYIAIYSNIKNMQIRSPIQKRREILLSPNHVKTNEEQIIRTLLKNRKYIVLQGAPGTGKTRMAKKIVEDECPVFFTQFHAETSYSDFVYGILPDVTKDQLLYRTNEGIFVKAIREALKSENNVYLIIDEINRANLSNVLGSAFYLFEPNMDIGNIEISICPSLSLKSLPENLYVIATMNTADRSIAVVDFALRRRFAWYTLYPHVIQDLDDDLIFCMDEFNKIASIFRRYASDEELNLQPGHAYFIVSRENKDDRMKERLKYELMPLIKEYILDGMLLRAKDEFMTFFRETIHEEMFQ